VGSHGDVELRRAGELVMGIVYVETEVFFEMLLAETGNCCRYMECFVEILRLKASS
jgi:hypothetical protein